jgi:hypothetical protein
VPSITSGGSRKGYYAIHCCGASLSLELSGPRSLVWTPSGHVRRDETLVAGPSTFLRLSYLSLWQRFTPGTRCDSATATFTMTIVSVPKATRSTSSTGRAAIAAARGAYTARGWSRKRSRPHSPGCEPASRLHQRCRQAQVNPSVRGVHHLGSLTLVDTGQPPYLIQMLHNLAIEPSAARRRQLGRALHH